MTTQLMIAAPNSGTGKTTVARGLMALFTRHGFKVQPFKCGPDYIDTKFHTAVCGRPSVNLDTFMASQEHVASLYSSYSKGADVCVVEGMMGLFDGYDRDKGSSAEVARVLQLPVVLVVDAKSAAYSLAPLLSGFIHFRHDVRIIGVIFNRVGSERHCQMLRQVCDDVNVECLGFVPRHEALQTNSRYLGLDYSEHADVDVLVDLLEKHVNWQRLAQLCEMPVKDDCTVRHDNVGSGQKVLVARNADSFSFIYQETIDAMGEVSFFDPEEDMPIPDDTSMLYLPGGYPEKHLQALAAARRTRESIAEYARNGGRIVAECGGMIYLCRSVLTDEGEWPMCDVLPVTIIARQKDKKLSLGYRSFEWRGRTWRGHEFHYTQFVQPPSALCNDIKVLDARGKEVATPIFHTDNVFASYTHIYWGENDMETIFNG